jgi:NAD(P)-dependent dehydrogenase (short-subunit alcohol dehydrogenase family)
MRPLEGAAAVVAGASGGLGRACALRLAGAGASLTLIARSAAAVETLAAEIRAGGEQAAAIRCDAADADRVRAAFAAMPAPDVFVNCVGGNHPEPFLQVTAGAFDWCWRVNVRSAFLASQAAAARMVDAKRAGSIVHVTSQMGHVGAPLRTAYCTAKHAVEGLTKAMAVELAPHGIRVNAVAPTFVETPMTKPFLAERRAREAIIAEIPLGRLGSPEEVAAAVVFVASPAAALMTGTSLRVDGGWTAR